jgi:1-phosphatidylinositol-3-phosphate 5-kinase
MDKYDISQLTEFPRYEPESSQSGVSTFFNKLWKFPLFSPGETAESSQDKTSGEGKQHEQSSNEQKETSKPEETETGTYAVEFEGRSLPNVLRRISSLVALGSGVNLIFFITFMSRVVSGKQKKEQQLFISFMDLT